jgi:hypothetical protein
LAAVLAAGTQTPTGVTAAPVVGQITLAPEDWLLLVRATSEVLGRLSAVVLLPVVVVVVALTQRVEIQLYPKVVSAATEQHLPWMPGCQTLTALVVAELALVSPALEERMPAMAAS